MEDLTTWLRQQLDDDEKVARAASPGPWAPSGHSVITVDDIEIADVPRRDASHIARHDPAAVLADVAAKRAALEATAGEIDRYGNMPPEAHIMADEVVKALASAYRHRPGWRTEWQT